jgi:hypothetical protein
MKLSRALHRVFVRQTAGCGRTWDRAGCPPPSRWWAVALRLDCWTEEEQRHITACPGCLRLQADYQAP